MTLTVPVLLLIVAVILAVLAAIPRVARGWMLALSLAFFEASFLVLRVS